MLLAAVLVWYLLNAQHEYVKDHVIGPHQYTTDFREAKKFALKEEAEAERQGEEVVGALVQNH